MQITDQQTWERLIPARAGSFLQSWEWNQAMNTVRCLFFRAEDEGVAVVERPVAGKLRYWDIEREKVSAKTLESVIKEAKKRGLVFVRVTPELEWGNALGPELKEMGFIYPKLFRRSHSPSATLLVDLIKDEKQLLAEMHQKTRYNIRVAERHGVQVAPVDANDAENFAVFWQVMEETAKRDGIKLLPRAHYQRILSLKKDPRTILLFARIREEVLSVMILMVHGATATYLHGGSATRGRNSMASTLLQWEAMKLAKQQGCDVYDFWGIQLDEHAPGAQPQDLGWAGITRFKKGFGGSTVRYLGTKDLPLRPMYYKLFSLAATVRS